jgi:hypothetical protein
MAQDLRRVKGESGYQNVGYRDLAGTILPAKITGSTALATPAAPTVVTVGAAGTTTYNYKVVARAGNGRTLASAATAIATGNAVLDNTNFNRITPATVVGATAYEIYGRPAVTGTEVLLGVLRADASPFQFDDKGGAAIGGAVPSVANAFRYNITVPALPAANRNKTNVAIAVSHSSTDAVVVGR